VSRKANPRMDGVIGMQRGCESGTGGLRPGTEMVGGVFLSLGVKWVICQQQFTCQRTRSVVSQHSSVRGVGMKLYFVAMLDTVHPRTGHEGQKGE
jgi:hypothetical protein